MEITPYTRTSYYYETDRMDVIHHSNYIRWFEEARIDFMDKMGIPYKKVEQLGIVSPVLYVDCQYISPVRFGETVNIYVNLVKFTGTRMDFSYKIVDSLSDTVRVTGKSGHCFVDDKFRPVSIKKSYPDIYNTYKVYEELPTERK